MNRLLDSVWQRRGTSWLWETEAFGSVCVAAEVWSLRKFLRVAGNWPEDLPSNHNKSLVVAGLGGGLDLLRPAEAEEWLASDIKDAILSFQSFYEGEAALIFWLPSVAARINVNSATDSVKWRCAHPYSDQQIEFGRVLWGDVGEYPQEIVLREGTKAVGLFHLRIT